MKWHGQSISLAGNGRVLEQWAILWVVCSYTVVRHPCQVFIIEAAMKCAQVKLFKTILSLTVWVFICLMLFGAVRATFAADTGQDLQMPITQQSQSKPPVSS